MLRIRIISAIILCCAGFSSLAAGPPFQTKEAERWADSVMSKLTRHERIAQLIMVAAWSNKDTTHINEIRKLITNWGIGGIIFFQGGPVRQALLTNDYQRLSKVPLMIGMDAEYGLAMRLDSTIRFPRQMTMSAIDSDSAVYQMGNEIARHCRRLGVHVNFAPDADINSNPNNPIIGSRAFSDDRESVARRSYYYMKALQDNHILATGKHFPGHGDADSDSHLTLPVIKQDTTALDTMELYPFRRLIAQGLGGMMVAHLSIPSLDSTPDLPSTLSEPIVTGLLKKKMGFQGLIFTDALNMKGISSCFRPGIADKLALLSGNDILLYSEDVRKAVEEIHLAIENCEILEGEVNERVRKVLMAKYWCGLQKGGIVDTANLYADLNNPHSRLLQRELYERSITVLQNKDSLLPFRTKDTLRIASVVIGDKLNNPFQQQLKKYGNVDFYFEDKDAPKSMFEAMFSFLSNYDYVIVSLHGTNMRAKDGFGVPEVSRRFIDSVMKSYKTIFVNFGNAYTLSLFRNIKKSRAVILAYEDFSLTHSMAAQVIMGGLSASGTMPIASNSTFPRGGQIKTRDPIRLTYTIPEAAGLSAEKLGSIDSLVNASIKAGAMPGCQVLVARHGKVVYQKSFGTHTFSRKDTVRNDDLYDIASITKISATALGVMKLYEQKKIDLDNVLSKYLPAARNTNKRNLVLKDVLTHQAGLQSWIPFYKETILDGKLSPVYYCNTSDEAYSIKVADSVYLLNSYVDTIRDRIMHSPLGPREKYVYSDLGPILMKEVIEKVSGKPFAEYIEDNFYKPLHLSGTAFNPLNRFLPGDIVPTEMDTVFRKQLLRGYVHDPAAAMFGGVSGNAGVFSDANDLAVIMQMLLNGGAYGNVRYLKESTVEKFTSRQFTKNRRGLLFDKPETDPDKPSPCSRSVSPMTFGHQGFTGTCAWADPETGIIFIFLSNRISPNASNDKFLKLNVRTGIQDIIYQAIIDNTAAAN